MLRDVYKHARKKNHGSLKIFVCYTAGKVGERGRQREVVILAQWPLNNTLLSRRAARSMYSDYFIRLIYGNDRGGCPVMRRFTK